MYNSCIKDECGSIVAWLSDVGYEEANKILEEHPEYYIDAEFCY